MISVYFKVPLLKFCGVLVVNAVSIVMGSGDDKFSVPKAPTKEEMSFNTYTARRKLNRLRRAACQLFTSDAMVTAIQRLELEVEAKRLLVRKDRHLWKDIGKHTVFQISEVLTRVEKKVHSNDMKRNTTFVISFCLR